MKIKLDPTHIIETYPYLEVGSKTVGQNNAPEIFHRSLPIYKATYKESKADIDLLIITSDLQGITEVNGKQFLLGEKLPSFLKTLLEIEFSHCKKIGVVLCGDMYTSLIKRGSSGDVRKVWSEFNAHFNWVVGVAGNHDTFGNEKEKAQFEAQENIHLLHKTNVKIDGLKFGGISGIIGRPDKINRVDETDFLKSLTHLSKQDLDFILLHETPDFPLLTEIGNETIRKHLEQLPPTQVCCGHCHWENSLVQLPNQTQVLNVDSKVICMEIIS
ncbi:Predicted phosphoesterase [Lishizhenia tianjinensis]|uniref:Predicted phosphoesterase n=1 Tax=Lishizhenia tianjinensis TaxID=477690 RepID=A0A1I7A247_9FLAO|nr:metallophosphoesterase [Lishizhenia tianjinensis]SFT68996.1 Predicted phosphoesterase [Lishizhenia tianjinensis]